jgi:hypothetical protein
MLDEPSTAVSRTNSKTLCERLDGQEAASDFILGTAGRMRYSCAARDMGSVKIAQAGSTRETA